ncbi:MAG: rRNA maturation RNase YbeY [Rikenellaceae bacterium]|nr:rRNA maturation RNase YbeY [Rikenellaceae bacterium]
MIRYFAEECNFSLKNKRKFNRWIKDTVSRENRATGDISVIFCSDEYLLEINRRYLGHDYFTDIITFDYGDGHTVSGDLFISVDTVKTNSEKFGAGFEEELNRVIIHGIIHLCGYNDKSLVEAKIMKEKENFYLSKFQI